MALAQLSIDIVAKLAEFQQDMRRAAAEADKGTAEIRKSLDGLKSFAADFLIGMGAGMAAAFSVGAIKDFIAHNVDAADELNRLSQSTGVSVEKLSQWGAVAKRNGLDVDDLAEQINELQAKLAETGQATDGTAYALKQLGLNYKDLKKLSSEAAFEKVAQALSQVEDSGTKAALAMAVGGDEYQKYLPVLNAIGAGGLQVAAITAEQARAAAHYKDSLAVLSIAGDGYAQQITAGIVPALDEFVQGLSSAMMGTDGMTAEARKLATNGTITEWARGAVTALTYLIDAGIYTGKVLTSIGKTAAAAAVQVVESMAGIGDVAAKVLAGDLSGAVDAAGAAIDRVKGAGQAWSDDMEESWSERTLGAKIRDRISDIQSVKVSSEAAAAAAGKIKVKFDPAAAKLAAEAAQKLKEVLGGINDKISAQRTELASTVQLTDAEKQRSDTMRQMADGRIKLGKAQQSQVAGALQELVTTEALLTAHRDIIKIRTGNAAAQAELDAGKAQTEGQKAALAWMERLRDGRIQLTEQQRIGIAAQYEEVLAGEKLIQQQQDLIKWLDESGAANLKAREDAQSRTQALRDQVQEEQRTTEGYGLSAEALTALTQARQLDTARALESRAAAMDGLPGYEQMTAEWKAQADAIREVIKQQQIRIDLEGMDAKDPYKGARQGIKDYLKDISAASDAAKSVTTKMLGGVEDELTNLVTTGQFNWKSLINSMISEALRLSVVRPMMSAFLNSSAGAGTASLIGNLVSAGASLFGGAGGAGNAGFGDYSGAGMAAAFGGGRANGGPVGAGTLYDVNERGTPELLTVGAKTMLMMGAEGGTVTPLTGLSAITSSSGAGASSSGGAAQPVIHQTFNFGGADTVTRAEMQRAAAEAKNAALSEWQNNRARGVRGYA